jgi:hypothetical protein
MIRQKLTGAFCNFSQGTRNNYNEDNKITQISGKQHLKLRRKCFPFKKIFIASKRAEAFVDSVSCIISRSQLRKGIWFVAKHAQLIVKL